jgi:GxxExxY protein
VRWGVVGDDVGGIVGDYAVDLLVEETMIVELKAFKTIVEMRHPQCIHYLRATGLQVSPLLNLGKARLEIQRIVLSR